MQSQKKIKSFKIDNKFNTIAKVDYDMINCGNNGFDVPIKFIVELYETQYNILKIEREL